MTDNYLLKTADAQDIYFKIKDLPIVDYHCHLSPKEIYEDKPFDNIGEMWLGGDHYKWRLMRTAGIDERYITGNTDWREKFIKYAAALELAAGNPLYHWSHMELSMFFDIDKPLKSDNAADLGFGEQDAAFTGLVFHGHDVGILLLTVDGHAAGSSAARAALPCESITRMVKGTKGAYRYSWPVLKPNAANAS